ncbi:hypothetical protein [Streptomyces brasiliensis]|uniref:Uncharacterized protein n=1 Tax=Streptomyces brasiliensis TaxID=1954 RepID=A0A917UME5_9ACTN|nr:hypothetical protein [Streptomyces brasiliensis]GGJ68045.1 hypothetical protein GCM10010121_093450 [Streptomyces brasiliensis]
MPQFTEGQYVSWDTRDGATTVQITAVDRFHITYRSADDHWEGVESTVFSSLEEKTADWRPATETEAMAFKTRFRPAPENWN